MLYIFIKIYSNRIFLKKAFLFQAQIKKKPININVDRLSKIQVVIPNV